MAGTESFYAAAERHIEWLTLCLGAAGAVFGAVRWGWRFGAGVALGAALGWINFRWIRQGVGTLVTVSVAQAGTEQARVPQGMYLKLFGRFALLLAAVYVIISRSILPMTPILAGLFALVAAVMLELLFELARGSHGTETLR